MIPHFHFIVYYCIVKYIIDKSMEFCQCTHLESCPEFCELPNESEICESEGVCTVGTLGIELVLLSFSDTITRHNRLENI